MFYSTVIPDSLRLPDRTRSCDPPSCLRVARDAHLRRAAHKLRQARRHGEFIAGEFDTAFSQFQAQYNRFAHRQINRSTGSDPVNINEGVAARFLLFSDIFRV